MDVNEQPRGSAPETTGQPVRSLQEMLDQLAVHNDAYMRLVPDGIYGERTLEAVMIFQREEKLPVTGVVNDQTWNAIVAAYERMEFLYGAPPPLSVLPDGTYTCCQGERSAPMFIVRGMFSALEQVTTNFSPCAGSDVNDGGTYENLRTVQRLSGLPVTGTLDRSTWACLCQLYHALVTRG